jgi:hypothetical protein
VNDDHVEFTALSSFCTSSGNASLTDMTRPRPRSLPHAPDPPTQPASSRAYLTYRSWSERSLS